jgi:hypothetical protein
MWEKLKRLLTWRTKAQEAGTEADVRYDPAEARTRAAGGTGDPGTADEHSTTGQPSEGPYVGRVAGQDTGYAHETGAERRAWE